MQKWWEGVDLPASGTTWLAGIPANWKDISLIAALLHDIGKAGDCQCHYFDKEDHPLDGYKYLRGEKIFLTHDHSGYLDVKKLGLNKFDRKIVQLAAALHWDFGNTMREIRKGQPGAIPPDLSLPAAKQQLKIFLDKIQKFAALVGYNHGRIDETLVRFVILMGAADVRGSSVNNYKNSVFDKSALLPAYSPPNMYQQYDYEGFGFTLRDEVIIYLTTQWMHDLLVSSKTTPGKVCGGNLVSHYLTSNAITTPSPMSFNQYEAYDLLRRQSRENLLRRFKALSDKAPISDTEVKIAAQVDKFWPPRIVNRTKSATVDLIKSGSKALIASTKTGAPLSNFAGQGENWLYSSFACVFATVGAHYGQDKYGDYGFILDQSVPMWGTYISGYSYFKNVYGESSHNDHPDKLTADNHSEKLKETFYSYTVTSNDLKAHFVAMIFESLRSGKRLGLGREAKAADLPAATGKTWALSDDQVEEITNKLITAASHEEFWNIVYGGKIAYLEARYMDDFRMDDVVGYFRKDGDTLNLKGAFKRLKDRFITWVDSFYLGAPIEVFN